MSVERKDLIVRKETVFKNTGKGATPEIIVEKFWVCDKGRNIVHNYTSLETDEQGNGNSYSNPYPSLEIALAALDDYYVQNCPEYREFTEYTADGVLIPKVVEAPESLPAQAQEEEYSYHGKTADELELERLLSLQTGRR